MQLLGSKGPEEQHIHKLDWILKAILNMAITITMNKILSKYGILQ